MWLGVVSILTVFTFALLKFLTAVHMRSLRETHMRLAHEVKKERQRLQALESKLQVQRATCGSAQQKLINARRFKDDLFARLRLELPSAMLPELRQCVNRHPIPEPEGVRTAHELRLAEKVSEALTHLSILVVEFDGQAQETQTASTVLHGELVQAIEARGVRHAHSRRDADESCLAVTTVFDGPDPAVDLLRALGAAHTGQIGCLRAVVAAGVDITEFEREHINRLFARTLHGTRQLLEEARPGTLVINEHAYSLLRDRRGVVELEGPEPIWILPLDTATDPPGADPAAADPEAAGAAAPDGSPAAAAPADPDRGRVATPAPAANAAPGTDGGPAPAKSQAPPPAPAKTPPSAAAQGPAVERP